MIKLVIALSTIRAGKPRAVEKMFMSKLPRTGFTNLEILLKKLYLEVIKLWSNMKQSNFKMKNLCSETLKTLINELNRPAGSA